MLLFWTSEGLWLLQNVVVFLSNIAGVLLCAVSYYARLYILSPYFYFHLYIKEKYV